MDINFNFSENREVLRDLFQNPEGYNLYHFHEKYLLSPAQLSRTIESFRNLDLVEIREEIVSLSTYGRKWVLANRRKIFFQSTEGYWKVPFIRFKEHDEKEISQTEERQSEPYFPKMSKVRLKFFGYDEDKGE